MCQIPWLGIVYLTPTKTHTARVVNKCAVYSQNLPIPPPNGIKGLSIIFALRFSWRTRQSNGKEVIKPLTQPTAWHLPYMEERRGCWIDSELAPACLSEALLRRRDRTLWDCSSSFCHAQQILTLWPSHPWWTELSVTHSNQSLLLFIFRYSMQQQNF